MILSSKSVAATAALITLIPLSATAGGVAEPPRPAPAPIPAPLPTGSDWSGFYGGLQLDYADTAITNGAAAFDEGTGFIYGLFGGYRQDFGNFVLGGEVDLSLADIPLDGAFNGSIDAVHRYGLEAGVDAGPALIYGTAGLAQAHARSGGADLTGNGYFFGAGVDYSLSDQMTVGAELLQHQFDDFNGSGLDVEATTFGINAAFRF